MASVYVASSWRNKTTLDATIELLRGERHKVYDFREDDYFAWEQCDPTWDRDEGKVTKPQQIIGLLDHPAAIRGFESDMGSLARAEVCVLAMPCGRSAHLELGYAIGAGKLTIVYLVEPCEPELMWKMADLVTDDIGAVLDLVKSFDQGNMLDPASLN